ncbi:uncharacterized protein LOC123259550 [Cotesia glomerata]|uniref:uncharacterized protein LOC123259550 n=1 Tax=Cotesia glomerata TaxID=32391 RepID=UPI001D00D25E|nr:uncharacterized protein LOC123259550 [Cotesia glomerata]
MNFFPYLDEKLNYQLYLLVYGHHKVSWYEKVISRIQELILSTNQLKNYELSILLLLAIGLIILIGYEIFKKCFTTLISRNQTEAQPVEEIKFSCEENNETKETCGPSTICEAQEKFNCQMMQPSQQIPYVIHCEGYKKVYVFTFDSDDLPVEISRELNIQNGNFNCKKYEAQDEVQEVMMLLIDKVLNNLSSRNDCQSDELLSINPISPNTVLTQENINQLKYLYNQSRIYKLKPASKIPLLLKSYKQKQFYKN